jgi:hypothetical protein
MIKVLGWDEAEDLDKMIKTQCAFEKHMHSIQMEFLKDKKWGFLKTCGIFPNQVEGLIKTQCAFEEDRTEVTDITWDGYPGQTGAEVLESVEKAIDMIRQDGGLNVRYKRQLKQEKINQAIRQLSEATGVDISEACEVLKKLGEARKPQQAVYMSCKGITQDTGVELYEMLEQHEQQQKINRAHYNKLLLKMGIEYKSPVKEFTMAFDALYTRQSDMQLKTYNNLRF